MERVRVVCKKCFYWALASFDNAKHLLHQKGVCVFSRFHGSLGKNVKAEVAYAHKLISIDGGGG